MAAPTIYVHLDRGETDVVWWAETPDIERLSVAAPSLPELCVLVDEAIRLYAPEAGEPTWVLVADNSSEEG